MHKTIKQRLDHKVPISSLPHHIAKRQNSAHYFLIPKRNHKAFISGPSAAISIENEHPLGANTE